MKNMIVVYLSQVLQVVFEPLILNQAADQLACLYFSSLINLILMKKLQHQTSCYAKTDTIIPPFSDQTSQPRHNQAPTLASSSQVKNLETKIFLLQERTKSIQQFYQQKMSQLKQVINKQHQTKMQLTQQLSRLIKQNLRQNSIITTLKNNLSEANIDPQQLKEARPNTNYIQSSLQKMRLRRSSKSKGQANPLFTSHRMLENNGKVLLKKTKSSQNIESYYYTGEAQSNPEKQAKFDFYKVRQ